MKTHIAVGFYVLGFLYFSMFCVCCHRLFLLFKHGNAAEHSVSRWFHLLISGVTVLRCIFVVLEPEKIGESDYGKEEGDYEEEAPQDDWDFIVGTFPAFLFFSTFLLLIVFWADLYYRFYNGEQMSEFRLGPLLRSINLCVYTILAIFYSLKLFDVVRDEVAIKCLYSYVFVVCCVCTGAFWFYGARLYLTFSQAPMRLSDRRASILRTVGTVTSISLVCMLTRSCIILTMAISEDLRSIWTGWLLIFYLLFTELTPLALILYVLRKMPSSQGSNSGNGPPAAAAATAVGGPKLTQPGSNPGLIYSHNSGINNQASLASDDSSEHGRNPRFGPSGKYGRYKAPGMGGGGVDAIIASAASQKYTEIYDPAENSSWSDANNDRRSAGYYG